jgi:hypothetical protein
MRYIIYGSAILFAILIVTIAISHLPREATASDDDTSGTVFQLEHRIDPKTLPQQHIPDEVYQ